MMAFLTVEDRFGSIELIVFPKTLASFGNFLYEGAVVSVLGTISSREDEEPKILVNQVEKVDKGSFTHTTSASKKESLSFETDRKVQPAVYLVPESAEAPLSYKDAKSLYLKVDTKDGVLFNKARRLIEIFDGTTPVFFYLEQDKKVLRAPSNLWVSLNDVLISELKNQLGEDNVKLKFTD